MFLILAGRVIVSSNCEYAKAHSLMLTTPSGMVSETSEVVPANAESSMEVSVAGRLIEVIVELPKA